MFVDTHAHLAFEDFTADLPQILERARAAGVERIVSIGCNLPSVKRTLAIAHEHPGVFATVGLHPGYIPEVTLCDMKEVRTLAADTKVVAIGETGLDYYRLPGVGRLTSGGAGDAAASGDAAYNIRQKQKDLLWAQLELAKELRLPVVIHNRSADADLLEILRAHAEGLPKDWRPWGVMHCFSGSEKFAFDCIEIGLFISYTGILTFKNSESLRDVAKKVSLDHVMLETDSPFLAPVPHRGKRNEPANVPQIATVLAEVKGVPVEEVARATTVNAERLFRLPAAG